uniref:NADH-ubiquinone oxidoreductase chain 3 n=1 Tax=Psilodens balduri TaxID=1494734 RepID=A0A2U8LL52_9MOLL|nr:NADH dehydrogenase subunit 3 [Psilodens balduri]
MKFLLLSGLLAAFIVTFMVITIFFLQKRMLLSEKSDSFECGFSMMKNSRIPFSTRYFLLTVIFLIFDIELVLLFPMMGYLSKTEAMNTLTMAIIFLILLVGIHYEWKEGSLEWMF